MRNLFAVAGGMVGGIITGALFGWIGHVRNIRPVLVFFRDDEDKRLNEWPKWKVKNVGQGTGMHIRIREYGPKPKSVEIRKVHPYAMEPGCVRQLDWMTVGSKIEADYTDVYGRRWYTSIAEYNDTVFRRRYWNFWRRPSRRELRQYETELHVLRSKRNSSTE